MPLSMKIGLVAIIAIAVTSGAGHAQSADTQDPSAQSSGTSSTDPGTTASTDPGSVPAVDPALGQTNADGTQFQYGVFREVVATAPVSQRNCWIQGLINGQTINGDLLTERVTLAQAQCVLNYLTRHGLCANQRTTSYWSARQDATSNGDPNNWNNTPGSNNWQNDNGSQGGDGAQSSGASRGGGGGHRRRQGQNGGDWQNNGDSPNGGHWTRQGEWVANGGVSPASINAICGGTGGTASGSTAGTGAGADSGTTSN